MTERSSAVERRRLRRALAVGAPVLIAALTAAPTAATEAQASGTWSCSAAPMPSTEATPSAATTRSTTSTRSEIVQAAGGTVVNDLSRQIGVMVVDSANAQFYALLSSLSTRSGRRSARIDRPSRCHLARGPLPAPGRRCRRSPAVGHGADPRATGARVADRHRGCRRRRPRLGDRRATTPTSTRGLDGKSNVDCARGRDFTFDSTPASPAGGTRRRARQQVPRHARRRHDRRPSQRPRRRRRRPGRHARPGQGLRGRPALLRQ